MTHTLPNTDRISRVTIHNCDNDLFSRTIVKLNAQMSINRGATEICKAGFFASRYDQSINSWVEKGDKKLETAEGSYMAAGSKGKKVLMMCAGRGRQSSKRVVAGHMAAIQYGKALSSSLHYRLAAECDQVLYFPLFEWSEGIGDEWWCSCVAEFYKCSLLGTYQQNSTMMKLRRAFGLYASRCKGPNANARQCAPMRVSRSLPATATGTAAAAPDGLLTNILGSSCGSSSRR